MTSKQLRWGESGFIRGTQINLISWRYSALHNALQHELFKIVFGCACTGPEMSQPPVSACPSARIFLLRLIVPRQGA
jgi:hypothetical protein